MDKSAWEKEEKHLKAVDVIKGLAIIMIILTHVSTIPLDLKLRIAYPYTILPAVPIFLICSGFLYLRSEQGKRCKNNQKIGGGTIDNIIYSWYDKTNFMRRINRLLYAYLVQWIILMGALFLIKGKVLAAPDALIMFLQGGRGPGAYYVLIMFQFLVIFPFLAYAFEKSPFGTSLGCFFFMLLWELVVSECKISGDVYHIVIFRVIPHIVMGMLLFRYYKKAGNTAIPVVCMLIGAIYLAAIYYFGYRQQLLARDATQGPIAALFSLGVVWYTLRLEPFWEKHKKMLSPLCFLGKASWHIFLVQMVYYYFARMIKFEQSFHSLGLAIVVDLLITITVGCLFYLLEKVVRNRF